MDSRLLQGISKYLSQEDLAKIAKVKIGIIGAGGLGSNAAIMLARTGFRQFVISDMDVVEASNLNRQFYFPADLGRMKVEALREQLAKLDQEIQVTLIKEKITGENFAEYYADCEIIIEAVDSEASKLMIYQEFKKAFAQGDKSLIMASGLAGYGLDLKMERRIIGKQIYLVGDEETSIATASPLAPRVNMAAALEADTALTIALGGRKNPRAKHMENFYTTPVYCLTDSKSSLGRSNYEVVEAMLKAGAKFIQYREKNKHMLDKYLEAREICNLTRKYQATFIINDNVDLALAVDADGVHLGQEDIPPVVARKLLGPTKILGISTHNPEQYREIVEINQRAEARGDLPVVDYIGVGPVYATKTKVDVVDPVGLEYPKFTVAENKIPFVAIGGIKLHNLAPVLELGVKTVAMVTAITGAENIEEVIKEVAQVKKAYVK